MPPRQLRETATDPNQYDAIGWGSKEDKPTPIRQFFITALKRRLGSLKSKSVLDIGSGVGHMFPLYKELDAKEVLGIEPSGRNVDISKELYPDILVKVESLESFEPDRKFDVVVMVMTMVHIKDLDTAFKKIHGLLRPGGLFVLIDADVTYETTPKWGWKIDVEQNSDGSYTVGSSRKYGYLASISRPIAHFMKAADATRFKVQEQSPLFASDDLLKEAQYYDEVRNIPLAQLFVFQT